MLPIVKRKTLEIPHTLAALAAAICLVIAFATDFTTRDNSLRAEVDQSDKVELIARHAGKPQDDTAPRTDTPRRGSGDGAAPASVPSGLLNWFGLPLQGR